MTEGLAAPGFLGVRRTPLAQAVKDLRSDDSSVFVLGGAGGTGRIQVFDLWGLPWI